MVLEGRQPEVTRKDFNGADGLASIFTMCAGIGNEKALHGQGLVFRVLERAKGIEVVSTCKIFSFAESLGIHMGIHGDRC